MSHPVQAILRGILTEIETEPILVPWVWNSRGLLIPRLFPRSFRRRARTDHFRKISGTWSGIKLIQQSIVQRIGLQPRDVAICIVNVTKGNCLGWTNLLAWSGLAMHARYRLVIQLGWLWFALIVAIDSDPMHLTPTPNLILPYHRDVVFGLTSNHAGVAADAGVQIDHHPQLMLSRQRYSEIV